MLKRLSELPEWHLVDTSSDIRGWKAYDKESREIGEVESLIVDTDKSVVRYLGIRTQEQIRLIPVNRVQIDRSARSVYLRDLTYQDLAEIPEFSEVCAIEDNADYVPSEEDLRVQDLVFEAVTLEQLMSQEWNRPENRGRLVVFYGSFGHAPEDAWQTPQITYSGYKIWDHVGNGIRCTNIYTALDKETGHLDTSHEFNLDSMNRIAFTYGTFVKVEGRYIPNACGDEPGVDVYFIDDRPVSQYLGSER